MYIGRVPHSELIYKVERTSQQKVDHFSHSSDDALPYRLHGAASVPHDGSFLVVGGADNNGQRVSYQDAVLRFDPDTESFAPIADGAGDLVTLSQEQMMSMATMVDPSDHPGCDQ